MSKEKMTKQNKQTIDKQNTTKQNKWFKIVVLSISVILLVLVLFGLLKINTNVKSEADKVMEKFNTYYESNSAKIIYYYDSTYEENDEGIFELDFIKQISKDYKIEYIELDKSKLGNKNLDYIYTTLGITGKIPTTILVKDRNVLGVQEGYVESNKLVDFMVSAKVLDEGSKYIPVENINFINYKDYKKIIDTKKKTSIVIVGKPACQYCLRIKMYANNLSKAYEVTINYMDVMDLTAQERKEFFEKLPDLGYDEESLKDNKFSMPTTFIIKDKKITAYQKGSQSLEVFKEFLKEQKVIE